MRQFSDSELQALRKQQDPLADEAVKAIFADDKAKYFREIISQLTFNSDEPKGELLAEVERFFKETDQLPYWANRQKMKTAVAVFKKNIVQIMSLLGTLSLPYCYAAADGAQVLALSERVKKDTYNRLLETALFIFDLFAQNSLEKSGRALRSIQKVRLIHAAIRLHISEYGQWNEEWGKPVNQEDMLGTNLAFSLILLRGLKKIGCSISPKESEAWLHAWSVYGYLMGIEADLLPQNLKEAFVLEKNIRKRNFKASDAGRMLTSSLVEYFRHLPETAKFPRGYMPSYMRFVLGEKTADLLAIPKANWSGIFVQQFRLLNLFGISPNQEPLTRELIIQQLSYEPNFATPEKLGF